MRRALILFGWAFYVARQAGRGNFSCAALPPAPTARITILSQRSISAAGSEAVNAPALDAFTRRVRTLTSSLYIVTLTRSFERKCRPCTVTGLRSSRRSAGRPDECPLEAEPRAATSPAVTRSPAISMSVSFLIASRVCPIQSGANHSAEGARYGAQYRNTHCTTGSRRFGRPLAAGPLAAKTTPGREPCSIRDHRFWPPPQ